MPGKARTHGTLKGKVQVMWCPKPDHPLRRFFAGLTETTFLNTLGIGDPHLVEYLSILLSRFIHVDAIHCLRNSHGKPLEEVGDMMLEAAAMPPEGRTRREYYRHIGDFALFWTGIYPEAVKRMRSVLRKDHFIDYCEQGKRSYYIASTFEEGPYRDEAPILRRLSDEFELCAYGLNQVRREWERSHPASAGQTRQQLLS